MAAEKVWIVNGQEYVPSNEMRIVEPVERYYLQRASGAPVQVEVQPRAVYVPPAYYPPPPPAPQVVIYQAAHNTNLVVGAFLALLVLLIVGLCAVLMLAWVAGGRLPWFGY